MPSVVKFDLQPSVDVPNFDVCKWQERFDFGVITHVIIDSLGNQIVPFGVEGVDRRCIATNLLLFSVYHHLRIV